MVKRINIKNKMDNNKYSEFCDIIKKQGHLVDCGSNEDKWIVVDFDNKVDMIFNIIAILDELPS